MIINATFFTGLFENNFETIEADEEEMQKAFADALKELRKYNNYTLKQVAKGTEIPFQTIARYESGENTPSIIQAFKLAYFYDISINDMFLLGYISDESKEKFFEEHYNKKR